MRTSPNSIRSRAAMTIAETMISAAILSLTMASLMVGISAIQRTFRASQHHATSQIQQARIIDYVGRDIRRSISVPVVDTVNGRQRLSMKIPNYYTSGGKTSYNVTDDSPRNPRISGGAIKYGPDGNTEVSIAYYQNGTDIYRSVDGQAVKLVSDVSDFNMSFPNANTQEVRIEVKFRPRYSFRMGNASLEDGTTITANILLRNLKKK